MLERRRGQLTREATGHGELRDDTESGDSLEVAIALKDEVEILVGRSDPEVVQGDIALGEDVLAGLGRLLLGFGDDLGVSGIAVVDVTRRR